MTNRWVTNDPHRAKQFRAADKLYFAAREAAEGLPLREKIEAYRKAKLARETAYKLILEGTPHEN